MKILFVNACVRKESRTLLLANELLAGISGEIDEIHLPSEGLMPLTEERITSRLNNLEEQKYAKQFAEADTIVIAAPLWDLSFPSILKVYVENICISGITFKYTEHGIVGLCKAKKIYYVSTAGGVDYPDFGFNYIKTLANMMFGIKEVVRFSAEGLDVWGNNIEQILETTIEKIEEHTKKE